MTMTEEPQTDPHVTELEMVVRQLAQEAHTAAHGTVIRDWRKCPRAICTRARHVLGLPDPEPIDLSSTEDAAVT